MSHWFGSAANLLPPGAEAREARYFNYTPGGVRYRPGTSGAAGAGAAGVAGAAAVAAAVASEESLLSRVQVSA